MSERFILAHEENGDMAVRGRGHWRLWRNIAGLGEVEDWVNWHLAVPDTGQQPETALTELLAIVERRKGG